MQYTSDAPPVRSLDVAGTETVNAGRYRDANARLRLNQKGQPVAIRRVVSLGQPGSFARHRYQVVTPAGIRAFSGSKIRTWEEKRSHPVN
jgi:hypothetical protein